MREIKLKDNAIVYVDTIEGDCGKLYDSDERLLGIFMVDGATTLDYMTLAETLATYNSVALYNYYFPEFDIGQSPQQVLEYELDRLHFTKSGTRMYIKDMLYDMRYETDNQLCDKYFINHIGNLYFREKE
jgi:hypothetical protein